MLHARTPFFQDPPFDNSVLFVVDRSTVSNKKAVYALVAQTLKFQQVIDQLVEDCRISVRKRPKALVYIMVYELLFSRRQKIQGGGKLKQVVARKEKALRASLARLLIQRQVDDVKLLIPEHLRGELGKNNPRYLRVNTIKMSVDDAIVTLRNDGFTQVIQDERMY